MSLSSSSQTKVRQLVEQSAMDLGQTSRIDLYARLTLEVIDEAKVSEARVLQVVRDCAALASAVGRANNNGMALFVYLVAHLLKLPPDAVLAAADRALKEGARA